MNSTTLNFSESRGYSAVTSRATAAEDQLNTLERALKAPEMRQTEQRSQYR